MFSHSHNAEADQVLLNGDRVIALYFRGEQGDDYEHNIFAPAKVYNQFYVFCLLCNLIAINIM